MSTTATYALLTRARRSLAKALSAAGTRPVLGVDFVSALGKLKALLAGGTAKSVATAVAVGSVAIGGVAVERAVEDRARRGSPRPQLSKLAARALRSVSGPPRPSAASDLRRECRERTRPGARIDEGRTGDRRGDGPALAPRGRARSTGRRRPRAGPAGGEPGDGHRSRGRTLPTARAGPRGGEVETPSLELPLVDDVVEDVVDPLLDDPLAVVPPIDVELPLDEVAPPLSEVEEDVENALETPLPDITPPLPKLPLP